jgi:hypothetical protein
MRPDLRKSLVLAGLVLGAVVVTAQALGGPRAVLSGVSCSKQPGHRYVAASSAELQAMLKCDVDGATIALKPGDYGRLDLTDIKGLTLLSDDPAKPASFEAIDIEGSNRVTLSRLRFGGGIDGVGYRLQIMNSADIAVAELDLSGAPGFGESVPGGVFVRSSNRVSLKRLKIALVANGIRILDTRQLVVADNIIRDFGSDAIQASAASQLVISGNYISRAHPVPGDHPDGVQVFTLGNQTAASDIVIKDNLIERGSGGLMQGIFVTDETEKNPFVGLQITNNIVIGSMYHGIMVAGADSGAVRGNLIVPVDGQKNWIMLVKAGPVVLEDNVAQDLIKDNVNLQSNADLGKNRRYITSQTEAAATSDAWKAKHFPVELRNGN